MNAQVQRALQERIEAFAADVTKILQDAVAVAVAEAFDAVPTSRRGSALRPRLTDAGGRRSRARMQQITDALLKEVQRQGGRRMEQIAESMGLKETKPLVTPMKKLLAAKKVKKRGQARGTTYRAA
jgi:hypothetical protein